MTTRRLSIDAPLALVGGVLVLITIGCSSNLLAPSGPSAGEVEALKQRVVKLQQEATVGKVETARLEREVARLEAELAKARLEAAPAAAERETITPAPGTIEPEIEEVDLEEPPIVAEVIAPEATAPEPVPPPVPVAAITTEAQSLYDEGYTLFHQKSYSEAESRFQHYVDLYPRTELADNALFWIGESRYARQDYSAALEAFSTTVERFPQGNKVADALFKAGRCLENLGELQQARSTYQEVARRYTGTAASAQARERLDVLR